MASVATIQVRWPSAFGADTVIINKADFDPAKHERIETAAVESSAGTVTEPVVAEPSAAAEPESLSVVEAAQGAAPAADSTVPRKRRTP